MKGLYKRAKGAAFLLLSALGLSHIAQAQDLPLWELGGGATVLRVPDYRGSEQVSNYIFPLPWLVYRGEIMRADREGVRASFFDSDRVELSLSLSASVPVDSDNNTARAAWLICAQWSRLVRAPTSICGGCRSPRRARSARSATRCLYRA